MSKHAVPPGHRLKDHTWYEWRYEHSSHDVFGFDLTTGRLTKR